MGVNGHVCRVVPGRLNFFSGVRTWAGGPAASLWIFHGATEDDVARSVRCSTTTLLLAFLAGAAGGCSVDVPAGPLPERPRDIDVSRLDPCALPGPPSTRLLGTERGEPDEQAVEGVTARSCSWHDFDRGQSHSVQLIDMDARRALGPGRSVETISGYGAVRQTEFSDSVPMCALVVDVHDGQSMRVLAQSMRHVEGAPRPIDEVCDEAVAHTAEIVEAARVIGY